MSKFRSLVELHTQTGFCPKWNDDISPSHDVLDLCPRLCRYPLESPLALGRINMQRREGFLEGIP